MVAQQFARLGAASLAALVLTAMPAWAQLGPGQQGPLWDRGNGYRSFPVIQSPAFAPLTSTPVTSQSYYNAPGQTDRSVLIQMRVPENAQIWFDDTATKQAGASRQFVSPPLVGGGTYVYQVRVQWKDGDQVKEQTRNVTVRAGDRINLEFGEGQADNPEVT